jgi:hypothetical protein
MTGRDQHVWTLRKGDHEATAVMREIPELGWDARLLFQGDLRQSRVFRDVQEALTWVADWRADLEAQGWVYAGR